jgi:hypothetical protein
MVLFCFVACLFVCLFVTTKNCVLCFIQTERTGEMSQLWEATRHAELPHADFDVAQIRVVVPTDYAATQDDCARVERDWRDVYNSRSGKHFAIAIDITDDSLTLFNSMLLAPTIVRTLHATRALAEGQMLATGFVTGSAGRTLISLVLGMGYGPAAEVVYGESIEELSVELHAAAQRKMASLLLLRK